MKRSRHAARSARGRIGKRVPGAARGGRRPGARLRLRRFRAPAVWLALAALAVGAAALHRAGYLAPPPATDSHGHALGPGPRFLVSLPFERVAAAEIAFGETTRRFERDESGAWREGESRDADVSARIETALSAFGRARIVREITASPDVKAYGVLTPRLSVALWTRDAQAPAARYFFGDLAPDELNRYVLVSGEFLVVTVPEYHAANLIGLVGGLEPR